MPKKLQKCRIMLSLSNREAEVAGYLALGSSEKEIADTLFVSVDTVHTHKKSIYRKWGIRNVADLTRRVAEHLTNSNLSDLIRHEIIEPNLRKAFTMFLFLSLQFTITLSNEMDQRPVRIRTNTVTRVGRTRKND